MFCSITSNDFTSAGLMFATRIGETRQLRWSMIDWQSRMIVIPAELTKTNVTHVLPLTPLAIDVLRAFEACKSDSDLMFPAGDEALNSQAAQDAIRQVSKGKWSAHDLRKLARSAWAELGVDYWVAERLLNHKPRGLDAVYIKTDGLAKRMEALQVYHEWLKNQGFSAGIMQALRNKSAA
jgi:integrase